MAKIDISTDELAALRPLSTEEVAERDKAIANPEFVDAIRDLSKDLKPGEDPFHRTRDDEARSQAPTSEVRAYIGPTAVPRLSEPTMDTDKVQLAPSIVNAPAKANVRNLPTELSLRVVADRETRARRSRALLALWFLVVALLAVGIWWLIRPTPPVPQQPATVIAAPAPSPTLARPSVAPDVAPTVATAAAGSASEAVEAPPPPPSASTHGKPPKQGPAAVETRPVF